MKRMSAVIPLLSHAFCELMSMYMPIDQVTKRVRGLITSLMVNSDSGRDIDRLFERGRKESRIKIQKTQTQTEPHLCRPW